MFFLITHIFIGKYYPNVVTQFIIGCICYVVSFLIISDVISHETYEQYKYYGLSLIGIDTAYLIYIGKTQKSNNTIVQTIQPKTLTRTVSQTTTNTTTSNNVSNISLSSEINDYKIKLFDTENIHEKSKSLDKDESSNKNSQNNKSNEPDISIGDDSLFLGSDNKNEISLSSLSKADTNSTN